MNYIEYHFTVSPVEQWREILLAQLSNLEFESFEDTDTGLKAYIRKNLDNENLVQSELDFFSAIQINYTRIEIEQQNWNEVWESGFSPILVENKCYIRAEFHEPKDEILYEIIIQPKMSFGTGHHETTYLMVDYLLETDLTGKDVMDMGCGTSILAILAKKKGANYVQGIDIEDWAVENSIENARRNQVEIDVFLGDVSSLTEIKFDVFLANINKNILLSDIPRYVKSINEEGALFLSGLLHTDFNDIKTRCEEFGLKFVSKKQKNEWIALHFIKTI